MLCRRVGIWEFLFTHGEYTQENIFHSHMKYVSTSNFTIHIYMNLCVRRYSFFVYSSFSIPVEFTHFISFTRRNEKYFPYLITLPNQNGDQNQNLCWFFLKTIFSIFTHWLKKNIVRRIARFAFISK